MPSSEVQAPAKRLYDVTTAQPVMNAHRPHQLGLAIDVRRRLALLVPTLKAETADLPPDKSTPYDNLNRQALAKLADDFAGTASR